MSGACCWVDTSEGDPASVYEKKDRIARKVWQCGECHRPIKRGEKYEYFRGCFDGHWSTFRTCWTCTLIRDEYCGHGFYYGELRETLWDCLGFNYITNEMAPWTEEYKEEHR